MVVEMSSIEVFNPNGPRPCAIYLCVSCRRMLYWRIWMFIIKMHLKIMLN